MPGPSTILVVDDKDYVATMLADILNDVGCGACQTLVVSSTRLTSQFSGGFPYHAS